MGRAPCCEKVGMKRGRWTAEEDEKLRKYSGKRKKNKNTDNLISSKPPNHDGEANAAVFIPTTPIPIRESMSSSTQRKENFGGGVVPQPEERECSIAVDCDLDDIVEDLNEILNRIGSRETDLCPENMMDASPLDLCSQNPMDFFSSDSWDWAPNIDENAFSWIWEDVGNNI